MVFEVKVATKEDLVFVETIIDEMAASAKVRGTGIARRSPNYIAQKIEEGKAVIAIAKNNEWAGFSYIETWTDTEYVANSGLIVNPKFRNQGLASQIKEAVFNLSRKRNPEAKIFGLTTSSAVMKINSDLGYRAATYAELTQDNQFWEGCESCVNYKILQSKGRKNCLCTAMLFDPKRLKKEK